MCITAVCIPTKTLPSQRLGRTVKMLLRMHRTDCVHELSCNKTSAGRQGPSPWQGISLSFPCKTRRLPSPAGQCHITPKLFSAQPSTVWTHNHTDKELKLFRPSPCRVWVEPGGWSRGLFWEQPLQHVECFQSGQFNRLADCSLAKNIFPTGLSD